MDISEHDIEVPISLSNSLFVEEEQQSRPNPNDLEEEDDISHIIYVHETLITCSPEVEIQLLVKVIIWMVIYYIPPLSLLPKMTTLLLPLKMMTHY